MRRFEIYEKALCDQGYSWQSASFIRALVAYFKGYKVRTLKHNIPSFCKHDWEEPVGTWADYDERCSKCGLRRSWKMDRIIIRGNRERYKADPF